MVQVMSLPCLLLILGCLEKNLLNETMTHKEKEDRKVAEIQKQINRSERDLGPVFPQQIYLPLI